MSHNVSEKSVSSWEHMVYLSHRDSHSIPPFSNYAISQDKFYDEESSWLFLKSGSCKNLIPYQDLLVLILYTFSKIRLTEENLEIISLSILSALKFISKR